MKTFFRTCMGLLLGLLLALPAFAQSNLSKLTVTYAPDGQLFVQNTTASGTFIPINARTRAVLAYVKNTCEKKLAIEYRIAHVSLEYAPQMGQCIMSRLAKWSSHTTIPKGYTPWRETVSGAPNRLRGAWGWARPTQTDTPNSPGTRHSLGASGPKVLLFPAKGR